MIFPTPQSFMTRHGAAPFKALMIALVCLVPTTTTVAQSTDVPPAVAAPTPNTAQAQTFTERTERYLEQARTAGAEVAKLESSLDALTNTPGALIPEGADQSALDVLSVQSRAALDEISAQRTQIAERTSQLPIEIAAARARVETLNDAPSGSTDTVQNAQLVTEQARLRMLETELSTLATRQSVVLVRQQLAKAEYEQLRDLVAVRTSALSEDQRARIRTFADSVRGTIDTRSTLASVQEFDAETGRRLAQLEGIVAATSNLDGDAASIERQNQRLSRSSETVARVLAVESPDTETIVLLRRIRDQLPSAQALQARLSDSEAVLNELELRSVLWSEQLDQLSDARDETAPIDTDVTPAAIRDRAAVLRELLIAVRRDAERRTRANLELADNLRLSTSLQTDLERRLLWIRSREDTIGDWVARTPAGLAYIASPTQWDVVSRAALQAARTKPLILLIWAFLLSLLWILRPQFKRRSARLAGRVDKLGQDAYWVTPAAIILDALCAVAGPAALIVIAAFIGGSDLGLSATPSQTIFLDNFNTVLQDVGVLLFFMLLFIRMARPGGTLCAHFGWSERARWSVSKHLRWFTPLLCLAVVVIGLTRDTGLTRVDNGVALLTFILISFAIATLAWMFLNPKSGVFSRASTGKASSPWLRLALVTAVAAPLIVGLLPLLGWIDTAQQLQARIFVSGFWGMMVALLYSLMFRTIRITEKRYAAARKRRLIAEMEAAEINVEESGEAVPLIAPEAETLEATDHLRDVLPWFSAVLFIGLLWLEWRTLIPAFGILDDIVLWSSQSVVDGVTTSTPTTVSTVILALAVFSISVFAAKNVKSLFELAAGRGVHMDTGTQYAAATLIGYLLLGIGVVVALGMLGLDWSKLQWIVAALGVGLGFGLQEIVANFISGIIILFERPVRVGDIVTINTLSGTVRDIRIRATMITDFDNRDVLLPNKSIITGEVTNWTLHDSVTRLVIPIGVAYGSDINKVQQLMIDVIEAEPEILSLPTPTVFMINHGDSSLDFELRVFVATPLQRLPVTHALNAAVNTALTSAGIEIPFPQRDVWHRNTAVTPDIAANTASTDGSE